MAWVVVITAADGTISAAGSFRGRIAAERWAADLELSTNGDLAGMAVELESPAAVMSEQMRA